MQHGHMKFTFIHMLSTDATSQSLLNKKGRRVGEERKEAFLGGGPVESAPITVIIIIMSEFGGDEWVGIIRPKSF
jgi:hypothetical protein